MLFLNHQQLVSLPYLHLLSPLRLHLPSTTGQSPLRETWTLVPHPSDLNVVSCKWVYSLKYNPDGSIARHKARLVARGFSQAYSLDYTETFSPVARLSSIRVLFSVALNQAWPLHQLDVSNAFLYGDLAK